MSVKHIVVVISGHGYGHAAMTAPLINALREKYSNVHITIRSSVPERFLRNKLGNEVRLLNESLDFGMVMNSAFSVDRTASLHRYQTIHRDWQSTVEQEMRRLEQLQPDLLISNIAYLPLFAAYRLEVPNAAFGCLNWADIFGYYFGDIPEAAPIYAQIEEAYQASDLFIRPEPTMPMPNFAGHTVGVCAVPGHKRGDEIRERLGLHEECRLVLASMGGIPTQLGAELWPTLDNLHYLIPDSPPLGRHDISSIDTQEFSFSDTLASADLLLTKPGYGAFSEAAINRIPTLYVDRQEWPEHPYLCEWLERHVPGQKISQQQFQRGDFAVELEKLLCGPITLAPPVPGIDQSLHLIEGLWAAR